MGMTHLPWPHTSPIAAPIVLSKCADLHRQLIRAVIDALTATTSSTGLHCHSWQVEKRWG